MAMNWLFFERTLKIVISSKEKMLYGKRMEIMDELQR